jgi:hypothetical protein
VTGKTDVMISTDWTPREYAYPLQKSHMMLTSDRIVGDDLSEKP